jgi:hypothetical protein
MLSFRAAIKVYLCPVAGDMRRSFDGLSMLAEHVIQCNPFSGLLSKVICLPQRQGKLALLGIVCFWSISITQLISSYVVLAGRLSLQAKTVLSYFS